MQQVAGQPFTAKLAAHLDAIGVGARVEVPVTRALVAEWRPAALTEPPAALAWDVPFGDGIVLPGEYQLVWRPDGDPPAFEVFVPLTVIHADAWAPTVDDVAKLCPAYTRHDIDADEEQAGAEHGIFDESTDPTAADVQGYINAAVLEVIGRVGVGHARLAEFPELARQTAAWHAAATVEAEKAPEGAEETEGAYRWKQASYVASLKELTTQARSFGIRIA